MSSSPHHKGSTSPEYEHRVDVQHGGDKAIIKPPALDITWGGDKRYWRFDKNEPFAVELVQVSWLEVKGSLDMKRLKPGIKYNLEFNVRLKPDAFGWNDSPVYIMVKLGKEKPMWKKADLSKLNESVSCAIPYPSRHEFTVPSVPGDEKLYFGLFEIWKARWKGGLVIENVTIERVVSIN